MGDVDGFKEVPSAGFIQTGQLYHSTMDGLHWYKPEHLERLTRAHAYLLSELNQHSFTELRQKSVSGDLPPPYSSPDFLRLLRPW
jgi:NDP-sugar pyrophosphorylase family protein